MNRSLPEPPSHVQRGSPLPAVPYYGGLLACLVRVNAPSNLISELRDVTTEARGTAVRCEAMRGPLCARCPR